MGMCSRQERIQKDIDVVIQKCKAEKDCLFAGEFLSRVPGCRRGGCRRPTQTPLPTWRGCPGGARALRRRFRSWGRRRVPVCLPSAPFLLLLAFWGHVRADETGKAGGGMGGHPESGSATVATRKRGGWVRVSVGECACVCPTLPGAAGGCWGERPAERSPAALCSGGCYAAVCRRPGSCHRPLPALIPAQLEGRGHGQR